MENTTRGKLNETIMKLNNSAKPFIMFNFPVFENTVWISLWKDVIN